MSGLDKVRSLRALLSAGYDRSVESEYAEAFEALDPQEGGILAREALAAIDGWNKSSAKSGKSELLRLACLVPGALLDVQSDLFTRKIFHPGILFMSATAEVRDRLIKRVESAPANTLELNHLLTCLAWVGDEAICQLFSGWRAAGKAFKELYVAPWQYAHEAGWDLDENGRRRDLISATAFALVPREATDHDASADHSTPTIMTPHESVCGWCGRQLTTLFDLDLRDERIASVASMPGERLRVAMCDRCTGCGVTYTDVDHRGGSRWSQANVRPDYLPDDDPIADYERPRERPLKLGPRRRTPYGTHLFIRGSGNSQLGGFATWQQDAAHPSCPTCRRAMPLIGQVEGTDLDELLEGVTYAFLCSGCGIAATSYQQT